ncbi:MAG: serine/threonine protein kinase [Holophagales bacterium]|nr:serine/threonine protein kinase [Holophagales bacterium]
MLPVVGGTYEVVEKLREGGMGAIYRVRHLLLDEPRVIKVMRASVEEDLHARERFLREAQMARRLSHPSIAVLHDLAEARPGTFYMVMELIDGPSLSDVLGAGRLLPVSVLLDLGAQALDGLQYLHDRGIIHRDVSPENLMVAEVAGRPALKIIDLGVAKREDEEGLTTTGVFVGKLRYASPEQLGSLKKGETIDGRSDVYSLGCVLYNLLTGSPAYLAETPQAWIRQHVLERPRPFATTDRTYRVPEPVRHAVLRALSKDRNARFSGAAEFASTLRGLTEALVREGGREAEARDLAESRSVLAQAHQAGARKGEPATVEDLAAERAPLAARRVPAGGRSRIRRRRGDGPHLLPVEGGPSIAGNRGIAPGSHGRRTGGGHRPPRHVGHGLVLEEGSGALPSGGPGGNRRARPEREPLGARRLRRRGVDGGGVRGWRRGHPVPGHPSVRALAHRRARRGRGRGCGDRRRPAGAPERGPPRPPRVRHRIGRAELRPRWHVERRRSSPWLSWRRFPSWPRRLRPGRWPTSTASALSTPATTPGPQPGCGRRSRKTPSKRRRSSGTERRTRRTTFRTSGWGSPSRSSAMPTGPGGRSESRRSRGRSGYGRRWRGSSMRRS